MTQDQIARYIELVRKLFGIISYQELEEYEELDMMYQEMQRRRKEVTHAGWEVMRGGLDEAD